MWTREIGARLWLALLCIAPGVASARTEIIPPPGSTYASPQDYQCVAGKYLTPGFSSVKDYYSVNADWSRYITSTYPGPEARGRRCFSATPAAAAANLASWFRYSRLEWAD